MSDGFVRRRGGGALATFSGFEGDLLRSLAQQLVELLRNEVAAPTAASDPLEDLLDFSGPTTAPEDPVLARLFPTAYPDDEEAAGEFRRFTESTLRDGKARCAVLVIDTLEQAGLPDELGEETVWVDVELDDADAQAWMKSFTDIRLALASRLGVEEGDEDYWESLPEDDPRAHVHDIYQWVGFLQETLVRALSR
ncbi:MAG: hypothetical protein AVDCRST_MAG72-520 [uncultured Nocardioidaceae bacterium]|uniref:Uncharacterized protein n=1 Tax=uncultured Nocardioidaceae bacterium TaxID=253824 RepID=A0A6J4LKR0_9ACTN|nr:MAG: hypothetical protein AVDCRST_MAG72-520 [uncultured Nocardioidaceae bacterium]